MRSSLKNLFLYTAASIFFAALISVTSLPSVFFVHAQVGEADYVGSFGANQTPVGQNTQTPVGQNTQTPVGQNTQTPVGQNTQTPVGQNGGGVTNPLKFGSIQAFFAQVLQFLVMLAIPFIIFMIIYTGFKFVTAQGNPGEIKTAQQMLMYTIIGGMLILGASIIANVIKGTVDSVTLLDHVLQAAAPLFNL